MRLSLLAIAGVLAGSCGLWLGIPAPVYAASPRAAPDPLWRVFDRHAGKGRPSPSLKSWRQMEPLRASTDDADARHAIEQMQAMTATEMGRYDDALAMFPFRAARPVATGPVPAAITIAIAIMARGRAGRRRIGRRGDRRQSRGATQAADTHR